ncbi:MAG: tRNA (adenosine(37)-N6)-threonylcarbamoyltransferase complex ATPase subunit type 1 TsaE [Candidatus Nanopelagicales bacterium]|nr:tRNA (adenosine(37)-N6)-threonylcarbamoyltransferase complex ATPase subunit type 1 TsaE [Candidatus Nanopelagicales bacterium]
MSPGPGWRRRGAQWSALAPDAEAMRALGAEVAAVLRPGDVVVLDGPLGAGKTTFTQGIGTALRVRGVVTSPTFVIARRHPGPGPALVHVDAYRLGTTVEVDDLDLDADLADAVTVVEWGVGKVEGLAPDRLEVRIDRPTGAEPGAEDPEDPSAGTRTVVVRGIGPRWAGLVLPPA